ncbi:trafficking protein particle complex subunit 6B isoform X2 [Tursiops truncatus]|uniref:Trafficking protein particle complex subunit 6B n=1 Tax=Tursiops truncatus TaxID=9739 RepID=A0A2U4AFG5_TURTR|nr:trafficking protein particle complex subunit 6B isoform X2 [Tursiops truncatus]
MKSPPDGRFPPRLAVGGWARLLAQSRGGFESLWVPEDENGRCITKLENMGFRVGQGLIERFTKDTARFKDELDIMKFICKDFWTTVFKKQIDNLRTNHQGIYVLQDNKFRLLTQMSAGKQYLEHASKYLAFTCGLIRGGLSNLGIKSIVTAEVSSMPACKFQVMIQKL